MRSMLLVASLVVSSCACQRGTGSSWPEGDALFRKDPKWIGGDAAFSVALGEGRVLWLFGDSFVAKSAANSRRESTLVRNSVAIQSGSSDPSTAQMTFTWRGTASAPTSYFPEPDADHWFWPGHGVMVGSSLVLFLQLQRRTNAGGAFGFEAEGWKVVIVDDPSGDPANWVMRTFTPQSPRAGLFVGSAVNVIDDHLVVLAQREPGNHEGFLVRWKTDALLAGRLDESEWFSGSSWSASAEPTVVLRDAGPESSLHFDGTRWIHLRSDGFGATTIVVSTADRIEGPWSTPGLVFRPPESELADTLVYAAKAHPALTSPDGSLLVTYASNSTDFVRLIDDTELYFPRFVRVVLNH